MDENTKALVAAQLVSGMLAADNRYPSGGDYIYAEIAASLFVKVMHALDAVRGQL